MVFHRQAVSISGVVTTCNWSSSSCIALQFPALNRSMKPNFMGDFFLAPSVLKYCLKFISLFNTELIMLFFHVQCKDCAARLKAIKGPLRPFCGLCLLTALTS